MGQNADLKIKFKHPHHCICGTKYSEKDGKARFSTIYDHIKKEFNKNPFKYINNK